MNDSNNIIRLPLWETVSRSYGYMFSAFGTFWNISAVWLSLVAVDAMLGFPMLKELIIISPRGADANGPLLLSLIYILGAAGVSVAMCRKIINKSPFKPFHFSLGRREWKFFGYSLVLPGLVVATSVALLFLVQFVLAFGDVLLSKRTSVYFFWAAALFFFIISFRFYLLFPAIAVGNKEINGKVSMEITRGNTLKIFIGYLLMGLPWVITYSLIAVAYNLVDGGLLWNLLLSFLFAVVYFFDAALKASFLSHVYQYLMFYTEKQQK